MKKQNETARDRATLRALGARVAAAIKRGERDAVRTIFGGAHIVRADLVREALAGAALKRRALKRREAARESGRVRPSRWMAIGARLFADAGAAAYVLAPMDHHVMGAYYALETPSGNTLGCEDHTREYSRSCRWRATHGRSVARLTHAAWRAAIRAAREYGPASVVGILPTWTRPAPRSNPDAVRRAVWLESENKWDAARYNPSCSVRVRRGYIVRDYHAATREDAERHLAARRAEEARRAEAATRAAKREADRRSERREALAHAAGSFADSLRAGNCEAGTRAFCARVGYGNDRGRRVSLRAVCHVAIRRGVWATAGQYVLRIARLFVPDATLDDLAAIARA